MALPLPGRHLEDPDKDEYFPPVSFQISKNRLFFKMLCEWCMKHSRKFRKRRPRGVLRKITLERLERKANSFRKKLNLEHLPPGWIQILKAEHGVLVEFPPPRWLATNSEELVQMASQVDMTDKCNNSGSHNSDANSSGCATTITATPEDSGGSSDGDIKTSSNGQNDDISVLPSETPTLDENDVTNFDSMTSNGSDGLLMNLNSSSPSSAEKTRQLVSKFERPISQWWLKCPNQMRLLLTRDLEETDTDSATSNKINTFSDSTCSSKISTIYNDTSSSSGSIFYTSPNTSGSSQEICSSGSISSDDDDVQND